MQVELKRPELGGEVNAGEVIVVRGKPGDTIAKDQAVLELETDKATIEVPSSVAGVVKDVKVAAGQKIKVGQTILTVDDAGAGAGDAQASGAAKKAEPEKPAPQPSGAPEERGLSQEVSEPADAPRVEAVEAPRQKRGEVVDISRAARTPPQPAPPPQPSTGNAPPPPPPLPPLARQLRVDIKHVSGTG